jgi:hypothetical protein
LSRDRSRYAPNAVRRECYSTRKVPQTTGRVGPDHDPQLDRTNTLHTRYVKKLSEQEDEMETLRKQMVSQNERATKARQAMNDFIMGLTIE